MLVIFDSITLYVHGFADYCKYMLKEKTIPIMIHNELKLADYNDSKVVSYDAIRHELFFPTQTRGENKETNQMCLKMAVEVAN